MTQRLLQLSDGKSVLRAVLWQWRVREESQTDPRDRTDSTWMWQLERQQNPRWLLREEPSLGENADTLSFEKLSKDQVSVQGRFPGPVVMWSKIILEQKEMK